MNMKQSCKALICAIEGELDGRHCTEEQAAAILDHALPSLTEALARVEAERDKVRAVLERVENERKNLQEQGGKLAVRWALAVNERKAAQAQLADVLYILDQHRAWTGMGWEQLPVPVHAVEKIRRKLAQAEQQEAPLGWAPCSPDLLKSGVCCESAPRIAGRPGSGVSHYHPAPKQEAQGAQAVDERAVLCDVVRETAKEFGEKVDEDGLQRDELGEFVHPEPKYLLRICQLYRVALATQPAVPVYLPEANVWDAPSMSADTEPEIAWRDGFNDARDRVMNAVRGAEQ